MESESWNMISQLANLNSRTEANTQSIANITAVTDVTGDNNISVATSGSKKALSLNTSLNLQALNVAGPITGPTALTLSNGMTFRTGLEGQSKIIDAAGGTDTYLSIYAGGTIGSKACLFMQNSRIIMLNNNNNPMMTFSTDVNILNVTAYNTIFSGIVNMTGTFNVTGSFNLPNGGVFTGTDGVACCWLQRGSGGNNYLILGGNASSTSSSIQITSNSVTINGTFVNSSDLRLKDDVKQLTNSTDVLKKIRGVNYVWKDGGAQGVGVLAQEVVEADPSLVIKGKDDMLSVSYNGLVAHLIETVNLLSSRIDVLEKAAVAQK